MDHLGVQVTQVSMDLLQDSSQTMRAVNIRLKSFLEQVNKLQEANHQLEAQIANWGVKNASDFEDWSEQEQTLRQLRTQVRFTSPLPSTT